MLFKRKNIHFNIFRLKASSVKLKKIFAILLILTLLHNVSKYYNVFYFIIVPFL